MTDQTKTTSELLKTLNEIRALEGKDPIAKWKRSRSDLETLLKTYDEEPEAEDQPNLPPASDPQYADDEALTLNQQLDALSDVIEQIVIPENDLEDQPNLPPASDPQYADDDVMDTIYSTTAPNNSFINPDTGEDVQLEDEELGKAIADVVLNAEDLTVPEQLLQLTDLAKHEAERNAAAEEIGFKEPDTGAENPAENVPRAKSPRGAIGVMVMDLLQTDMPYKDIVKQVRETYWDAKTTERSVASIAMDLRRDGVNVPARRKPAAIKQVVAAAQATQPSTEVPEGLADQA